VLVARRSQFIVVEAVGSVSDGTHPDSRQLSLLVVAPSDVGQRITDQSLASLLFIVH
jgi:hypothetical protein